MDRLIDKFEIAKEAYKQIAKAILDLEEKHDILCDLPHFIEVDGERFHIMNVKRNRFHKSSINPFSEQLPNACQKND